MYAEVMVGAMLDHKNQAILGYQVRLMPTESVGLTSRLRIRNLANVSRSSPPRIACGVDGDDGQIAVQFSNPRAFVQAI